MGSLWDNRLSATEVHPNKPGTARFKRARCFLMLLTPYSAYKFCVLLMLHNKLLAREIGGVAPQDLFVASFCTWALVTGTVLAVLTIRSGRHRVYSTASPVRQNALLALAATATGGMLLLVSAFGSSPVMLCVAIALVSLACAVANFRWAKTLLLVPLHTALLSLAVGQLCASTCFFFIKLAPSAVQAVSFLLACIALAATTSHLENKQELLTKLYSHPGISAGEDSIPDNPSTSHHWMLAGVAISTTGVGILWGSSQSIGAYELWVIGAVVVCIVLVLLVALLKPKLRSDLILNAVFVVLGLALLTTVLFPSVERLFMGVVWCGYTVLSMAVFSLGWLYPNNRMQRLGLGLAGFAASIGIGLFFGRLISLFAPHVEAPALVAVVLFLTSVLLMGYTVHPIVPTKNHAPSNGHNAAPNPLQDNCHNLTAQHGLSTAEEETLLYLSRGYTIRCIAQERAVSENTIKTQISSIYRKLGIHSKQELLEMVNGRL